MRVVVAADWHLDWRTAGVPRLPEVKAHALEVAGAARNADLFVHLGDLRDPGRDDLRMGAELSRLVAEVSAACPSIWLVGNHDVVDRDGEPLTTLSHLACLSSEKPTRRGEFLVVERPRLLYYQGTPMLFLPYPSRAAAARWQDDVEVVAGLVETERREREVGDLVVFSHLCLPHLQPGDETGDMGRGRDVFFPNRILQLRPRAILNGHYHEHCRYDWDGVEVVVPGSPVRFTFGDRAPRKGYVIIEL